jgi:transcriptional regulator with XRE-family HTH domain
MPIRIDPEARIAASPQNKTAGTLIKRARTTADMPQGEFAEKVARRLGLVGISQSALSDWERGTRQVPGAAIIAAAEVAHMRPHELFMAAAEAESQLESTMRTLERVTGGLTPKQKERLKKTVAR